MPHIINLDVANWAGLVMGQKSKQTRCNWFTCKHCLIINAFVTIRKTILLQQLSKSLN